MYCEKAKALIKGLGFKYEEKMYGVDFKTPKELFKEIGKQMPGAIGAQQGAVSTAILDEFTKFINLYEINLIWGRLWD